VTASSCTEAGAVDSDGVLGRASAARFVHHAELSGRESVRVETMSVGVQLSQPFGGPTVSYVGVNPVGRLLKQMCPGQQD
jgi:hypothetical protein